MRLKQKIALFLAGIMMCGTVVMMNPAQAQAAETNTFTLTVPANTNITRVGWNEIGKVEVTGSIEATKKVVVAITTDNNSRLKYGNNQIKYTIQTALDAEETSSIEFDAAAVNGSTASQAIGADVSDFSSKPAGEYEDTIRYTATLEDAVRGFSLSGCTECKCEKTFSVSNISELGKDTPFTHKDKTYYAYNSFIPSTSGTCWHEAQAFVAELNTAFPQKDGTQWMLIDSADMAYDWWITTGSDVNKGAGSFGDVVCVWSSQSNQSNGVSYGYLWDCSGAAFAVDNGNDTDNVKFCDWIYGTKSNTDTYYGFVVVRGSTSN